MGSLYSQFLLNDGKPIHKNAHYFPVYERHFAPWVNRPVTLLEIGTGGGGSSQMWKRYFGPYARIVSIDKKPHRVEHEDAQVKVRIGDQSDPEFLASLLQEFGAPDIVLDDGSHRMHHVNASFDFLFPRMSPSGVYLVEDMHTAYWDEYGGGLRRNGTFIERAKAMVDDLNAAHVREPFLESPARGATLSIHFYDSIVVLEKGVPADRGSYITGATTTY